MIDDGKELFTAVHHTSCSACNRAEPQQPLPGWTNNGRFMVIKRVKLCFGCIKELQAKLDALGLTRNDDLPTA